MMTTQDQPRQDRPLTIDEVVALDNIPAEAEPSQDVVDALSSRVVHFSARGRDLEELRRALYQHPDEEGVVSLRLPESTFIGLAGRNGERVDAATLTRADEASTTGQPSKPPWAPRVFHPKLSARPLTKTLRRADGSRVTPLNQSFIYGPDDRHVFYPSGYPWQCIGKVEVYPNASADSPNEWGSGVLIGDRLVLTAGHVPPVNPPPGQWKMRFTAGLYDGSSVEGAGAVSYVSDFRGYLGGVSSKDYAVLRLYEPLGTWLGYYGWKTYSGAWDGGAYWWLAGYPFDVASANRPSYQSGIPVLDRDSDGGGLELEHHGDIASGDSGGPFWGFWSDGFPYVVGTTSGHETRSGPSWVGGEDNNIEAGGDELSNLLAWGRATWPL
jgi:V8-like Glu-specific endopeptidase